MMPFFMPWVGEENMNGIKATVFNRLFQNLHGSVLNNSNVAKVGWVDAVQPAPKARGVNLNA